MAYPYGWFLGWAIELRVVDFFAFDLGVGNQNLGLMGQSAFQVNGLRLRQVVFQFGLKSKEDSI